MGNEINQLRKAARGTGNWQMPVAHQLFGRKRTNLHEKYDYPMTRSASAASVRAATDGPGKLRFNEDVTGSRWKRLRRRCTVDHDTPSSAAAVLACCSVVPRSPRVRSTLAILAVRSSQLRRCAIDRLRLSHVRLHWHDLEPPSRIGKIFEPLRLQTSVLRDEQCATKLD